MKCICTSATLAKSGGSNCQGLAILLAGFLGGTHVRTIAYGGSQNPSGCALAGARGSCPLGEHYAAWRCDKQIRLGRVVMGNAHPHDSI
jgi:hypothetical protein